MVIGVVVTVQADDAANNVRTAAANGRVVLLLGQVPKTEAPVPQDVGSDHVDNGRDATLALGGPGTRERIQKSGRFRPGSRCSDVTCRVICLYRDNDVDHHRHHNDKGHGDQREGRSLLGFSEFQNFESTKTLFNLAILLFVVVAAAVEEVVVVAVDNRTRQLTSKQLFHTAWSSFSSDRLPSPRFPYRKSWVPTMWTSWSGHKSGGRGPRTREPVRGPRRPCRRHQLFRRYLTRLL